MSATSLGIAIPSFNQAAYVGETLRSIQAFDFPFEAIIRDAGSTDGTLEAIERQVGNDPRFRLDVRDRERQAAAINQAWRELLERHPLVTWMNTDDVYHHQPYGRLVGALASMPDTSMMFGDFHRIDKDGHRLDTSRRPRRIRRTMLTYYHSNLVPGLGMSVRSEAVRKVGLLDEALEYAFDYEFWLRVAQSGAIRKHDEVVAAFRWHDEAKTAGRAEESREEHDRIAEARRKPWASTVLRPATRAVAKFNRTIGRWS